MKIPDMVFGKTKEKGEEMQTAVAESKPTKVILPLMLGRISKKPSSEKLMDGARKRFGFGTLGNMTIVTTPGFQPEMNDQEEDDTSYRRD